MIEVPKMPEIPEMVRDFSIFKVEVNLENVWRDFYEQIGHMLTNKDMITLYFEFFILGHLNCMDPESKFNKNYNGRENEKKESKEQSNSDEATK